MSELSSLAQQLFLIYGGERRYFKGYGHFINEGRKAGHFATSANSTWSPFEK
jgi:hypothetical protein